MTVWIVCTMMFGTCAPMLDGPEFTNESACVIYLATIHSQTKASFKLVCNTK